MRRGVVVAIVLAVMALLLWMALDAAREATGPEGGPGTDAAAPADDAESDADRAARRRKEEPVRERREDTARTAFQQNWPAVGQDGDQDPDLAQILGRLLLAPGKPADDAVVEASRKGVLLVRAHVPASGAFVLKNVPPGDAIDLDARAPGHAPGAVENLRLEAGQRVDVGTLYLGAALAPGVDNRVEVTVRGPDGQAVQGARVTITTIAYAALITLGPYEKQPGGTVVRAETDARGRVEFGPVPPASYDVLAEAEGFSFDVIQRFVVQKDTRASLDFSLRPGLSITGRVTDTAGEPVAGARVGCFLWGVFTSFPSCTTDADGAFHLKGLKPGQYFLFAATPDRGSKEQRNVAAGTEGLAIVLDPGVAVAIAVKDKATGQPVTRFGVRPYRPIPFAYQFSPLFEVVAEDGIFRTNLPETQYGAEISADGYSLVTIDSVPLGTPEPHLVELEPAGVVHGRVVSRDTREPVVGAQVYVQREGFPPSPYKDQQTTTDHGGVFVLDRLAPTRLTLRIAHVDNSTQDFQGVSPEPRGADGALPPVVEFALGSGGRIEGRVTGPDGVPLVGQTMQLSGVGFEFSSSRTVLTAEHGVYVFRNVPPGDKYRVTIGEFVPGRPSQSRSDFTVREGETTTVDFVPEAGGMAVRGRVTRAGAPVGEVMVSLQSESGSGSLLQARAGADGTFVFEAVQPGKYLVTSQRGGIGRAQVVVTADAPPPEVEIVLPTGSIVGKVVDALTKAPIDGVYVECERVTTEGSSNLSRLSQAWGDNDSSRGDGSFHLDGLEAGDYIVRAMHDGHGTEVIEAVVSAPKEDGTIPTSTVTIEMGAVGLLTGRVTDAGGVPVDGVTVRVFDHRGREQTFVSLVKSRGDGHYTQATLKPGRYRVRFERSGYAPAEVAVTVEEGVPATADVVLQPGVKIRVTVRNPSQKPVKGATLKVFDASGRAVGAGLDISTLFSTKVPATDVNGEATVEDLAPGRYVVRAEGGNGTVGEGTVEIMAGEGAVEITVSGRE